MNKQELIEKYVNDMTKKKDVLRTMFSNINGSDFKKIETGFSECMTVSVTWIEQMLDYVEQDNVLGVTPKEKDIFFNKDKLSTEPDKKEENKNKLKKIGNALGETGKDVLKFFGSSSPPTGLVKKNLYEI